MTIIISGDTGVPVSPVTGTLAVANGGTGTTSTTFVNLATNVTGTLPVANGGTGVTTSTGTGNVVLSASPTLSGYVTTPNQPAFAASGVSSNVSYVAGSVLQFSTSDLNRGSNFDISTYRFTAPVAGVYYFSVTAYANTANAAVVFRKNGAEIYGAGDPSPLLFLPTAGSAASISTILSLSVNDYVDTATRLGSGTLLIYMGHSEFLGYLIG